MQTYFRLADLPRFRRAVVTIGSFDGVHRGHQQLLKRIRRMAEVRGGESVVITFDPHPRSVLRPDDDSLRLLTTTREKIECCDAQGIDHLVVVPFDLAFSQQTPAEYIQNFLVRNFHPDRIVIGYDHRFGKDRSGNVELLRYYAPEFGYEVIEIAAQEVHDMTVSSTLIRRALQQGNVAGARDLMGRPYQITGQVVRGRQLGRTINYPTANIAPEHALKLIPANGIYAVRATLDECRYDGMLYIGERPVLDDGRGRTIELHLFDFTGDIYDKNLTVAFVDYLRVDQSLPDLEALRLQLQQDERDTRRRLEEDRQANQPARGELPDTAVVILNYNGREYLERYLGTVVEHLIPRARVIVADNASTDDSVAFLHERFPDVRCIQLPENLGFAAGYNEALQQVDAEVFVLLNSDVRVTAGWLESVLPHFANPLVGAVQPKILSEHEPESFEYAGASGGYLDYLGYPFCRGRVFGHNERDEGQYDCPTDIFWATGAAFFVRASAFNAMQGFEPEYFAHAEEIDLCWRLKRAGYRILVEPAATVYHVGGGTLAYESPRKTFLNFRNSLVTIFKNDHAMRLAWLLPLRLLLDGAAGLLFLSQGKVDHIASILRAHLDFYRNLPLWVYRRSRRTAEIEAARVGPPQTDAGRVADSIALHYFLLGHDRFSQVVIPQVKVEPAAVPMN